MKEKKNNYKESYKDKQKAEKYIIENNYKSEENYHMQIQKFKNEREKIREKNMRKRNENINKINNNYKISYNNNINETKKLKNELLKLELMEEQCIENLKKTQEYIRNNNEDNMRFNTFQKVKFDDNENNYYNNSYKRRTANSTKKRNKNKLINQSKEIKDKSSSIPKLGNNS